MFLQGVATELELEAGSCRLAVSLYGKFCKCQKLEAELFLKGQLCAADNPAAKIELMVSFLFAQTIFLNKKYLKPFLRQF